MVVQGSDFQRLQLNCSEFDGLESLLLILTFSSWRTAKVSLMVWIFTFSSWRTAIVV
jgi:hypothetical protein